MRCRRKPSSCRLTAQHPQQLPHISALVVASVIAYWINSHGRVRHTDRWAIIDARKPRSNQSSPSHPPAVTWCDGGPRSSSVLNGCGPPARASASSATPQSRCTEASLLANISTTYGTQRVFKAVMIICSASGWPWITKASCSRAKLMVS